MAEIRVRHMLRHNDGIQFVDLDGRLFNCNHIVAVTNTLSGQSIVTTQSRDFDVELPFAEVVRLLTLTVEED